MRLGIALLAAVVVIGTLGYVALGLSLLDGLYQTITTVFTVGFRELGVSDARWKVFTMVVIVGGVGTALYTLGTLFEALVEGQLTDHFGRRRMDKRIEGLHDHVIVCGWGRVGRALTGRLQASGPCEVVVIDRDADRLAGIASLHIVGEATDDDVLRRAGIEHAKALVAAVNTDADNLYITLSGRSLRSDLFIVSRARVESAEAKLLQAGADRVVNPQTLGGARIAALVGQPHVADFLDVVMHDGSLEFRLEEVAVPERSALVGRTLREAQIRDQTGALVLALRDQQGGFTTNPGPDTPVARGQVLIAIGTQAQLEALSALAAR